MRIIIFIACVLLISTQACQFNSVEELFPAGNCDTTKTKYGTVISKIITTNCATFSSCHKGAAVGAIRGNFDGHAGIKMYLDNNKQRFINAINHNAGVSAMPKGGTKLSDCDILMITTWINKGYRNN